MTRGGESGPCENTRGQKHVDAPEIAVRSVAEE
jgi:hypothetical protein